jgi:undecaprenyl-diphosphatase
MLETIGQIDQAVTLLINHFSNASADALMIAISDKKTWIPLYLGLLFLFNKIFGWKHSLIVVVAIVLNLVLTDQISVFFKEYFMRLRPCHETSLLEILKLPDGCGGKFGFVSSHAANTMGLAVLVALILKNKWMTLAMLSFAIANGYSRIYLGKHYFLDVVGGFVLGVLLAWFVYHAMLYSIKRFNLK